MARDPFNLSLMDVEKEIAKYNMLEVTSPLIREPSSNMFHPQGLFSEEIFGQIGTNARLIRFGWINLNCKVFHPLIFQNLKALKSFYVDIMSGKSYATWNKELGDFDHASEDDPEADTGFTFFLTHFPEINWRKNASLKREDKIDLILQFPDRLLIDKFLVLPAGIRDIRITDGKQEKDVVNNLYMSLMNNCKAMPPSAWQRPIYDSVHYAIQRKVNEIYLHILSMMTGKKGFLESKYGARALALGTRNVIASSIMAAKDPKDPQYHKVDETKVPLFQAAKALQPLVIYNLKQFFFSTVLSASSDQVSLINPQTLQLEYQPITESEKDRLLSSEGIVKMIDLFQDADFRFRPLTVETENKKHYYMFMIYDLDQQIILVRDVNSLKQQLEKMNLLYDPSRLRPITYCEILYIATWMSSIGKTGTVTRYPVTDAGSIYVSKIHLISTVPSRVVQLINGSTEPVTMPEYPILNSSFTDALLLHPSRLAPLGGDFDGNCLIGTTTVTLRYTNLWYTQLQTADYSASQLDKDSILKNLKDKTFLTKDGWNYCEIQMQEFPVTGPFKLDRNGARVFDVAPGCEIMSYQSGPNQGSWEPISGVTIEDDCEAVSCTVANREIGVSTNESLAVFDQNTGGLRRIAPKDTNATTRIPVFKRKPLFGDSDNWSSPIVHDREDDVIPLTVEEENYLRTYTGVKTLGFIQRDELMQYADYIGKETPLWQRLNNKDIIWSYPKNITTLGPQRVYDFLVESTKVFVVNEGVVVYDTVNWVPILSKEANEEALGYLKTLNNYLSPSGKLLLAFDDLVSLTMYNMTEDPDPEDLK